MSMKDDLRLYILMRNDLQSMPPGRCMAQAAHAANALIKQFPNNSKVTLWQKQTKQGFGTTIVLAASRSKIEDILSDVDPKQFPCKGWVTDPEYAIRVTLEIAQLLHQNYDADYCNFVFNYDLADETTVPIIRKEVTCAFILGSKAELEPYLGDLKLY